MTITPTDDITALLELDHEAIRERLLELENADACDRAALFAELTAALTRHEVAEETVVYPAVRREQGGVAVVEARLAEETEVEQLLAHIRQLDTGTEEFVGAVKDLRSAVLSHAAQEESHVVPILLAINEGAYLSFLGQKFRGEKLGAPTHPHPHLPNSALGNKVLGPFVSFIDRLREAG
jgi:Hemerythrin HHE cation binding domain